MEKVKEIEGNSFFGYFGLNAFSKDDNYHIVNKIQIYNKFPSINDCTEIGLKNINTNSWIHIVRSNCWNFQQGPLAQFFNYEDKELIILNKEINNSIGSAIFDKNGCEFKTFENPCYAIDDRGVFFVSISPESIYKYQSGYHYSLSEGKNWGGEIYLRYVSIKDSTIKTYSLEEICEAINLDVKLYKTAFICHPSISKKGNYVAFILRFAQDNGFQTSSLIVHDLNNDQFRMYFNCANVSHFSWIDDESIIIWKGLDGAIGRFKKKNKVPKVLSKVLMPIYKKMMKEGNLIRKVIANECYEILNVKENLNRKIDFNNSWTDGHPVAMPNTNEILTDTYQKDKYRKLYIFDYLKETIEHERYILSDDKTDNSNLRCDLHPRVSRSGKYISVDKIFNQKRVIEIYKI